MVQRAVRSVGTMAYANAGVRAREAEHAAAMLRGQYRVPTVHDAQLVDAAPALIRGALDDNETAEISNL